MGFEMATFIKCTLKANYFLAEFEIYGLFMRFLCRLLFVEWMIWLSDMLIRISHHRF